MIVYNEQKEELEIKEVLSFKHHVLPYFNEIKQDIEGFDPLQENEKEFLKYTLSHDDKMNILHYIEDEYERKTNYYDEVSIFDEEMIKECIMNWITDNFDIEF